MNLVNDDLMFDTSIKDYKTIQDQTMIYQSKLKNQSSDKSAVNDNSPNSKSTNERSTLTKKVIVKPRYFNFDWEKKPIIETSQP